MIGRSCRRWIVVLLAVGFAAPAWAGLLGADREVSIGTGVAFRSWTVKLEGEEDIEVGQLSIPLVAHAPVGGDNLNFTLFAARASSEYKISEEAKLSGFTDTQLRLSYRMNNERVLWTAGFALPTGPTDLSEDEVRVSRAISNEVLGFRTNRYGAGLDLFGSVLFAWPLSNSVSAGGGVGVARRGAFDYAPDAENGLGEVDLGDEFFASAGASYLRRRETGGTSFNLDLTYRLFGTDQVEGTEVFEEGDELVLLATAAHETERVRLAGRVRGVFKGDNSLMGTALEWNAGTDLDNLVQSSIAGDRFDLGCDLAYRLTPIWSVSGVVRHSRFGEAIAEGGEEKSSVASRGKANVTELGPAVTWEATETLLLRLGFGFLFGSAEDGDADLSGHDLVVTGTFRL
jgi:hypothetical protein